jgi:geranylgeranyl diphosphate synthase, type II
MAVQVLKKLKDEGSQGMSHFFFHRDKIEKDIARSIASLGDKTPLRDACEYALTNGGKRYRPLIVMMVAEALGHGLDVSDAALSVEYFHTASLIADDLPCMDNDDERRNKPTVHKVYGETIALLSSYALITAAFEKIHKATVSLHQAGSIFSENANRAGMIALECASYCSGIKGATGGQYLDLYPPSATLEAVKEIIEKKTVTLFEVAFVFGYVFGGGDLSLVEDVEMLGYHLGMAFQIADDIEDLLQDDKHPKNLSMAKLVGIERSFVLFEEHMQALIEKLKSLKLYTPSFAKMTDMLLLSTRALKN